jgi:DNA polymerase-3 subunit gamma/tau
MARIIAKAVNCLDPRDGAPCAVCAMCVSIAEGRTSDIVEIDGASNTGIDDIRVLRERAAYAPTEAKFKIYIIDEVHRLSPQAFDGLLKTLEEPPAHVLFVFASTEPHKVPLTILSRCQRFDFRKIDRETISTRLTDVAAAEGLVLDANAKELIGQQAGGSLRDALGILDQVRAFAGEKITAEDVRMGAGIGRPQIIADLTTRMLQGDAGGSLRAINEATAQGVDPASLGRQLVEYWRALLLQTSGARAEVDLDPALMDTLAAHATSLTPELALAALRGLTEQVIEPRLNVPPQLPLEIAVVQAILAVSSGSGDGDSSIQRPTGDMPQAASPPTQRAGKAARSAGEPLPMAKPPPRSVAENPAPSAGDIEPSAGEPEPLTSEPNGNGSSAGQTLSEAWPLVIEAARARSRRLQGVLRDAVPMTCDDAEVTLGFQYAFHRDESDRQENRTEIEALIATVMGRRLRIRCILVENDASRTRAAESDGFFEEAERMLRGIHARKFRSSKSDS